MSTLHCFSHHHHNFLTTVPEAKLKPITETRRTDQQTTRRCACVSTPLTPDHHTGAGSRNGGHRGDVRRAVGLCKEECGPYNILTKMGRGSPRGRTVIKVYWYPAPQFQGVSQASTKTSGDESKPGPGKSKTWNPMSFFLEEGYECC
jgi:hypothetical protein